MQEFNVTKKSGQIIIVSDCHLDYFDGVAGYSSRERMSHMTEAIMKQENVDCVIFAGDISFRNSFAGLPLDSIYEWKHTVADKITDAGIPVFVINASHDSMYQSEFYDVFGYNNNYAVINGDVAYICLDTYAGERDASAQTTASDITPDILDDSLEIASRPEIKATFVVCHYPNSGVNLAKLINDEHITAVIAGHTHDNTIVNVREAEVNADKKLLQTGHFSRAYTKLIHEGCGFKRFVPMIHGDGMTVSDRDGVTPIEDFSATGSPWQYRAVARTIDGIESYMIFPEMDYFEFVGDGNVFPSFHQPYAEGFGDRSYIKFQI